MQIITFKLDYHWNIFLGQNWFAFCWWGLNVCNWISFCKHYTKNLKKCFGKKGKPPCDGNKQYNIFCLAIVSFLTLFKQNLVHGLELGLSASYMQQQFLTTTKFWKIITQRGGRSLFIIVLLSMNAFPKFNIEIMMVLASWCLVWIQNQNFVKL